MSQSEDLLKKIISHCKEYGFIFQSSEIYDGLSAVYDYGPNGVELKNNIKKFWWDSMVTINENIVGLDSSVFMHPTVWKASGHIDAFNDPLIDNKDSKKRYRVDVLIEDHIEKIQQKISKEVAKASKRFGESFEEKQFLETNGRVVSYNEKIAKIEAQLKEALEQNNLESLKSIILENEIKDPEGGSMNWTDVRQFNLMFSTEMGSVDGSKIYLRPETAQGIFVNFLNVQKSSRKKIPFGIAQIGKAYRNEIIARQFIFRMREFEQMEMQFFVKPGTEMKWYEYWKTYRMKWHELLNKQTDTYRFHDHISLAHYANAACDIEYKFPMGFKELEGIHSRTDFDLKSHEEHSGKKMRYFDQEENQSYIPYVVETSIGLDRMFLSILSSSYVEETVDNATRTVLKVPFALAPYKIAVFPLTKKDGMPEMAKNIYNQLKYDFSAIYEEKDNIGKRYRRQDAIGTPFCITIDNDSVSTNMVTIRDRDSMKQDSVNIDNVYTYLKDRLDTKDLLSKLHE